MILNGKEYDETNPKAIVEAAYNLANHMGACLGTVHWIKCLDLSARQMRRLAHAMDIMRESTTYVEHK